ncbi:MAG: hypothetical protein KUG58_07170 [Marinosulfonomonas sp.]|nr:hypothetical protein [Marinosulfonomonas sp.]
MNNFETGNRKIGAPMHGSGIHSFAFADAVFVRDGDGAIACRYPRLGLVENKVRKNREFGVVVLDGLSEEA